MNLKAGENLNKIRSSLVESYGVAEDGFPAQAVESGVESTGKAGFSVLLPEQ
jgi:hypothetical protein